MGAADFDSSRTAIVSGSAGLGEPFGRRVESAGGFVTIEQQNPHRIAVTLDCGNAAGFLVWSQAWYPGWRATIDGGPVPVERANHAFQGIAAPHGVHRIEVNYQPSTYRVGLYVTALWLGAIGGGMSFGATARRARWRLARIERAGGGIEEVSGVQSIP
jgi:hypothetical protein